MARWPNAKFSDDTVWDNDNYWAKGTIDDDENAYTNGTIIDDPYTNSAGTILISMPLVLILMKRINRPLLYSILGPSGPGLD